MNLTLSPGYHLTDEAEPKLVHTLSGRRYWPGNLSEFPCSRGLTSARHFVRRLTAGMSLDPAGRARGPVHRPGAADQRATLGTVRALRLGAQLCDQPRPPVRPMLMNRCLLINWSQVRVLAGAPLLKRFFQSSLTNPIPAHLNKQLTNSVERMYCPLRTATKTMKTTTSQPVTETASPVTSACLKRAWIRDQTVPAGRPAQGRINCPCGQAPLSWFRPDNGDVLCACGTRYTWDGWIKSEPRQVPGWPGEPKHGGESERRCVRQLMATMDALMLSEKEPTA